MIQKKNLFFQRGNISGHIIENAYVWPRSGAVSVGGALVEDSFLDRYAHESAVREGECSWRPAAASTLAVAASLGHVYRNYFHRHIDCIPRVYSLHHPIFHGEREIHVLVNSSFSDDECELIQALCPKNAKVVRPRNDWQVYRVRRYIHLPFMSSRRTQDFRWWNNCGGYLPQEYLRFLRQTAWRMFCPQLDSMPGKAIFVSRKSASVRRLVNDQQARALLCSLGFRVLECERLTLRQQVQEFSSADIVVGLHGAGLTNIVYSPKGSHVIEILSNSPCKIYESLAVALGMEYKSIVCDGRKKNDDVQVALPELASKVSEVRRSNECAL